MSEGQSGLPFFPIPVVGETVYSLFCRYAERSGIPYTHLMSMLTNQRLKTSLLSALPGYLTFISETMPIGHPWRDAELIVKNHTALPYYLYFDSKQERNLQIERLTKSESSMSICMSIGMRTYRCAPTPKHPRFCLECVKKDNADHGFACFRREHQLPGVAVCCQHGEKLFHGCTECGPYPIKNRALSMPGKCHCTDGITPLEVLPNLSTNSENLLWIAKQSAFMVCSGGTRCQNIRSVLRRMVIEKGLGNGSLINSKKLATAIENRYGKEVLDWLGTPVWENNHPSAWVRRLLGRNLNKRSPAIYFLLIIGALFDSVETFENTAEELQESAVSNKKTDEVFGAKEKQRKGGANEAMSDWLRNYYTFEKTNIHKIAQQFNISYYKVITELQRQGLRVPLSRHLKNKLDDKKLSAIRKDLSNGFLKTEICRRHGCSEWALTMIELDLPGLNSMYHEALNIRIRDQHRQRLMSYIKKHEGINRTNIQECLSGTYDYLISHDKEWFYTQIPKRKQRTINKPREPLRDWAALDEKKSKELECFFDKVFEVGIKRPIWATKYGALKSINLSTQYTARPYLFTRVGDVLRKRVESLSDFHKRRLRWAIMQMDNNKKALSVNKLRRVAGLDSRILRNFKQYVIDVAIELNGEINERSFFASTD